MKYVMYYFCRCPSSKGAFRSAVGTVQLPDQTRHSGIDASVASSLLRGHVRRCSKNRSRFCQRVDLRVIQRQAKVQDFDLPPAIRILLRRMMFWGFTSRWTMRSACAA